MNALNSHGQRLARSIANAHEQDAHETRQTLHAEKVNIVGAGGALTAAYEQLRNAAENTEEHLLLQRAIHRFYKQLFITRDEGLVRTSGNELAVELTFAGYVPNNSLTKEQLAKVSKLASEHYEAYEKLLQHRSIAADKSADWVLDTLAVQVEQLINSHRVDEAFVETAYGYFESTIDRDVVAKTADEREYYAISLFMAIHKALLKSDVTMMRSELVRRYRVSPTDLDSYIALNKQIDTILEAEITDRLYRVVDRQGAPLRIVRRMIEDHENFADLLRRRDAFLDEFEKQVDKEYATIGRRINRAIVRSVAFLIITKFLIGIAIEVPYDIWAHGQILWLPLIINLLFPPLYMIALRLTHNLPGYANTTALVDRIDSMFYGEQTTLLKSQLSAKRYSSIFSVMYALLSFVVFAAVVWALLMLQFSFVHIIIFFVFISAASFLGFRLSRLIRELEIVRSSSNGLTFIRDFVYLPFVVVGQWLSEKYSRVNIVATILDMMIELPLKTVLRLIRQWGAFIDDRKDHI